MPTKKASTRSTRTTKVAASAVQRPVSTIVEHLHSGLTALRKKVKAGAKSGKTDAGKIDAAIAHLAQDYARMFGDKGG